jgi:hypothetical protein
MDEEQKEGTSAGKSSAMTDDILSQSDDEDTGAPTRKRNSRSNPARNRRSTSQDAETGEEPADKEAEEEEEEEVGEEMGRFYALSERLAASFVPFGHRDRAAAVAQAQVLLRLLRKGMEYAFSRPPTTHKFLHGMKRFVSKVDRPQLPYL